MAATLSTLFTASDKARLTQAVQMRTSCRNFSGEADAAQFAALSYAVGRYALPGARLVLLRVPDATFAGTLTAPRRITGCTMLAAVIVSTKDPLSRISAGIAGEALVLEATHLGLGSCWAGGSFRRQEVRVALEHDEALLCVIALGRPASPLGAPESRRRKALDSFCRGDWRTWPQTLQNAAALVQQAPSAMNLQPWTLALDAQSRFLLDASERAHLDAGIALCHAELALETPHAWRFANNPHEALACAESAV